MEKQKILRAIENIQQHFLRKMVRFKQVIRSPICLKNVILKIDHTNFLKTMDQNFTILRFLSYRNTTGATIHVILDDVQLLNNFIGTRYFEI